MSVADDRAFADRLDAALKLDGPPPPPLAETVRAGRAAVRRRRRQRGIGVLALVLVAGGSGAFLVQQVTPDADSTTVASSAGDARQERVLESQDRKVVPGVPFVQPWNGRSVYYFGQDATPATIVPGTDRFEARAGNRVLEQRRGPGVVVDQEGSTAVSVALVERGGERSEDRRVYMLLVRGVDGEAQTYAVAFDRGGDDLDEFLALVVESGEYYGPESGRQ